MFLPVSAFWEFSWRFLSSVKSVSILRGRIITPGIKSLVVVSGEGGVRVFMDVRVFNPFPPSNAQMSLDKCFVKHEKEKKRAYEQRTHEVEHASFVPLVMSAAGGMAKEATNFYKRLASLLAEKWDQPYSNTLHWLRCSISFSLLRSAIQCIRGARSSRSHPVNLLPVDLVTAEACLQPINLNYCYTLHLIFMFAFGIISVNFTFA